MARLCFSIAVTPPSDLRSRGDYRFSEAHGDVNPIVASTYAASKTAFEAALATLVADGASPTEAHATAVNDAYTTLLADLASRPVKTDMVVSFDTTAVPSRSVVRRALRAIEAAIESVTMTA